MNASALAIREESLIAPDGFEAAADLQLESTSSEVSLPSRRDVDMVALTESPDWKRKKAEKYLAAINAFQGLKGQALRNAIEHWNQTHPGLKTSYPRVLVARETLEVCGVEGLLARYGQRKGESSIPQHAFETFKSLYLKEGSPPASMCWAATVGFHQGIDLPKVNAFIRRLESEMGESAIQLRRLGPSKHNRKYGPFIERNYDNLDCGRVWVFDHAQIDVMVIGPDGKPAVPWVTAIADMKSGKMIATYVHLEAPNSDHIFQAMYYAIRDYGVPDHIYIDNGKDFRVSDFSGGRSKYRMQVDILKTRSLAEMLGFAVHFALPYNAQAKIIERIFKKQKTMLSTMMPGYRGGNVVEKPEILYGHAGRKNGEIKSGSLIALKDFEKLYDKFVIDVLNKMPSSGKVLRGQSPHAYFAVNALPFRRVTEDALVMLCMRVSRVFTVGRNGIKDAKEGIIYWDERLVPLYGQKVFLRRADRSMLKAFVFNATTDEFICKAVALQAVDALALNDVSRSDLRAATSRKNRAQKITRELGITIQRPEPYAIIEAMATYAASQNPAEDLDAPAKGETIVMTAMDRVLSAEKQAQKVGSLPLKAAIPEHSEDEREPIFAWSTDRAQHLRKKAGLG